jgi:hypothetical protein
VHSQAISRKGGRCERWGCADDRPLVYTPDSYDADAINRCRAHAASTLRADDFPGTWLTALFSRCATVTASTLQS